MHMEINNLFAEINLPDAPSGEGIHQLPPYCKADVYKVDDYNCPENWMHGSAKASSYFVKVEPGKHLWLDFNRNYNHTHHIAIVLSVQGINPITGQKCNNLKLEQYRDKCPEHNIEFGQDRYCKKCKFKWPSQNYMTTASTMNGLLWVDGWRSTDDQIRGFLITKDSAKGVAAQLIGDDRVFAIGIAFYRAKEPKPIVHTYTRPLIHKMIPNTFWEITDGCQIGCSDIGVWNSTSDGVCGPQGVMGVNGAVGSSEPAWSAGHVGSTDPKRMKPKRMKRSVKLNSFSSSSSPSSSSSSSSSSSALSFSSSPDSVLRSMAETESEIDTNLEIAAGAKIKQTLAFHDNNDVSYYDLEPAGMIYINYVCPAEFKRIMNKGLRDRTNQGEGFLKDLIKGNA